MPSVHEWFVVDEAKLPRQGAGSDQATYDALVQAVRQVGAKWATVELDTGAYAEGLERIDEVLGGTGFLPVLTFNNSPHNVLGGDPDVDADFSYLSPQMVQDLWATLQELPDGVVGGFEEDALLEPVYYAVMDTCEEAARRGHAIAVLHDGG